MCIGTVLLQGTDDGVVCVEVAFDFPRFNVEHIDQDRDVRKDIPSLRGEIGLHERILPVDS